MAFKKSHQTEQCIIRLHDIKSTIATTPSERPNKSGWDKRAKDQLLNCQQSRGSLMIIGDAIIAGLGRYRYIWEKYFKDYGTINCGIGGDRTENVLVRAGKMVLPKSLEYVVVNCGTNNLKHHSPEEIASGIIQIGVVLIKKRPDLKIFFTGILPKGLKWTRVRSKILKTNSYLKILSGRYSNFSYVSYTHEWTLDNGDLDQRYFYSDFIHLVEKGNEVLAKSIQKSLSSSSSSSSSSSQSITSSYPSSLSSLSSCSSQSPSLSSKSSSRNTILSISKPQHTMAHNLSFRCPYNLSHYDNFFPSLSTLPPKKLLLTKFSPSFSHLTFPQPLPRSSSPPSIPQIGLVKVIKKSILPLKVQKISPPKTTILNSYSTQLYRVKVKHSTVFYHLPKIIITKVDRLVDDKKKINIIAADNVVTSIAVDENVASIVAVKNVTSIVADKKLTSIVADKVMPIIIDKNYSPIDEKIKLNASQGYGFNGFQKMFFSRKLDRFYELNLDYRFLYFDSLFSIFKFFIRLKFNFLTFLTLQIFIIYFFSSTFHSYNYSDFNKLVISNNKIGEHRTFFAVIFSIKKVLIISEISIQITFVKGTSSAILMLIWIQKISLVFNGLNQK